MKRALIFILAILAVAHSQEVYEEFESNFFGSAFKDSEGWIATGAASEKFADQVVKCGGSPVFGGQKAFGKGSVLGKEFKLPPHFRVKINVKLWRIGYWAENRMFLYADGNMWETMWNQKSEGASLCTGTEGTASEHEVEYVFTHANAGLVVFFGTSAEKEIKTQAYGIREFKLSYIPCPAECGTCLGPDAPLCVMWTPIGMSFYTMEGGKDSEGWVLDKGTDAVSTCSGVKIQGGVVNYAKGTELVKIFKDLPPHYRLKVQFQFWKVDKWQSDSAQLYVDRQVKWSQVFGAKDGETLCPTPVGGGDYPERPFDVNFETPHYYDAANIKFTSTLAIDKKKAGWGIRQFYAFVAKCAKNCEACLGPEIEDCSSCVSPYVLAEDGTGCKLIGDWKKVDEDLQKEWTSASQDWKVSGAQGGPDFATECSGLKLFGGYEKFAAGAEVKRTFKLPAHKRVRIVLEAWKIDEWMGEKYVIKANGVTVFERQFGLSDPGLQDICGGEGFENMANVDVILGHEEENLELLITSTLGTDNVKGSWAFRSFELYIEEPDKCATLYTECNYLGKSFDMCEDEPNFTTALHPSKIKSVQVPEGFVIELYDEHDYKGNKIEYKENTACIENYDYQLINLKPPKIALSKNQHKTH